MLKRATKFAIFFLIVPCPAIAVENTSNEAACPWYSFCQLEKIFDNAIQNPPTDGGSSSETTVKNDNASVNPKKESIPNIDFDASTSNETSKFKTINWFLPCTDPNDSKNWRNDEEYIKNETYAAWEKEHGPLADAHCPGSDKAPEAPMPASAPELPVDQIIKAESAFFEMYNNKDKPATKTQTGTATETNAPVRQPTPPPKTSNPGTIPVGISGQSSPGNSTITGTTNDVRPNVASLAPNSIQPARVGAVLPGNAETRAAGPVPTDTSGASAAPYVPHISATGAKKILPALSGSGHGNLTMPTALTARQTPRQVPRPASPTTTSEQAYVDPSPPPPPVYAAPNTPSVDLGQAAEVMSGLANVLGAAAAIAGARTGGPVYVPSFRSAAPAIRQAPTPSYTFRPTNSGAQSTITGF